jgi:NAD(P)-dependent dehydrogenase (short-subunit alcohol dehydrogenase family)
MSGRFEDRVAFITGGARGQGRSHAVRFAEEGADVVVVDLGDHDLQTVGYPLPTPDDLDETVRLVEATGRRALGVTADVRDLGAMAHAVDASLEAFGKIDILAANAAICTFSPVASMTRRTWDETIDVNLSGAFNSIRAVVPHMLERGSGRIIATASGGRTSPTTRRPSGA